MRVTVRRPECSKTYVFDEFDNVLNSVGGDIPTNWMASSGNIRDIHFSRQEDIEIGGFAFCDCSGLNGNIVIPDNITGIGQKAFSQSDNIDNIFINLGTGSLFDTAVEQNPFYDCSGNLYVTSQYIDEYTSVGEYYPVDNPNEGRKVVLWSNYPNTP